jgi:hypothetical protein
MTNKIQTCCLRQSDSFFINKKFGLAHKHCLLIHLPGQHAKCQSDTSLNVKMLPSEADATKDQFIIVKAAKNK